MVDFLFKYFHSLILDKIHTDFNFKESISLVTNQFVNRNERKRQIWFTRLFYWRDPKLLKITRTIVSWILIFSYLISGYVQLL